MLLVSVSDATITSLCFSFGLAACGVDLISSSGLRVDLIPGQTSQPSLVVQAENCGKLRAGLSNQVNQVAASFRSHFIKWLLLCVRSWKLMGPRWFDLMSDPRF